MAGKIREQVFKVIERALEEEINVAIFVGECDFVVAEFDSLVFFEVFSVIAEIIESLVNELDSVG